jgi:hypothetical protein
LPCIRVLGVRRKTREFRKYPPTQSSNLEGDLSGDEETGETDEQEYAGEDASEYEDMAVDSTDDDDIDESSDEGVLDL